MSGRLPDSEYRARPWRIHEIAPDFALEDVWELPWHGTADEFPRLVEMIAASDPAERSPAPVRLLWALLSPIGETDSIPCKPAWLVRICFVLGDRPRGRLLRSPQRDVRSRLRGDEGQGMNAWLRDRNRSRFTDLGPGRWKPHVAFALAAWAALFMRGATPARSD